jgi:hypothetical protein
MFSNIITTYEMSTFGFLLLREMGTEMSNIYLPAEIYNPKNSCEPYRGMRER